MNCKYLKYISIILIVGILFIGATSSICHAALKVAVLDSGFSKEFGNALSFTSLSPYNDPLNHGKNISQIIKRHAPNTEIYVLQVCEEKNNHYGPEPKAILKAINWCIENNIDIVNLSLTIKYNRDIAKAIEYGYRNKGIIFVAAAGNKSWSSGFAARDDGFVYLKKNELSFPASCDYVISVGASSKNKVAKYSVNGADISTSGSFENMKGTSVACAYTTAKIANTLSNYPHRDINSLKSLIRR